MTGFSLPRVMVLATGGTIAGVQNHGTSYSAGQLTAEALLSVLPDMSGVADLSAEQLANVGSQSITYAIWCDILRRVAEIVRNDQADAVVITHGTDTMEETAYFLQLALPANLPVILTGAMRPANAWGADGPRNLFDAIRVAAASVSVRNGVGIVMNGHIHDARYVQKKSCEGLDAFESREAGPIGRVDAQKIVWFVAPAEKKYAAGSALALSEPVNDQPPHVPVWYASAIPDEITLDAILHTNPQGIIVAGVGNGNMPQSVVSRLQQAASQGLVVVRTSRCSAGFVTRNLEINDDACGFIVAHDLNPQKARVLLMLALQKTNKPARIQEFFNKY